MGQLSPSSGAIALTSTMQPERKSYAPPPDAITHTGINCSRVLAQAGEQIVLAVRRRDKRERTDVALDGEDTRRKVRRQRE